MLIRLMGNQVANVWEELKGSILGAMPPTATLTEDSLNHILIQLVNETMIAWVAVEETQMVGVVITTVTQDVGSADKNLLIYSLYGYKLISDAVWKDSLETLKEFAKANDCKAIIGYTEVPRIIEIVRQLGGEAKTVLVRLEV